MKTSWAQPSLSRDFLLLLAAILFTLSLISAWVIFITYRQNNERVTQELEKESVRIERTLAAQMESANYLLTALGRQIVLDPDRSPVRLAKLLKSFDSKGYIYTVFSWIGPEQKIIASSNKGVLDQPVDISDRDYVQKSQAEPWKMAIGKPIEGRVSAHWVIPAAMGLTDYTGKFIGTLLISIDINVLTEQISAIVRREGISFAIISKSLLPLTQVSNDKDFVKHNFPETTLSNVDFSKAAHGLLAQGNMLWGTGNYVYYRVSDPYPYIILLGYDAHYSDAPIHTLLWSRFLQIATVAVFFMAFFWIVRARLIRPVLDMTGIAATVARGLPAATLPTHGPLEIRELAVQIQRISDYIEETRRIEDELRNKAFLLKKAKERAEIGARHTSAFLAYSCQEMRGALNNIIGYAQVMKDQLYGPIENKKYRQYVADITLAGNELMAKTQDLLTVAKAETGAIALQPEPLGLAEALNGALRMIADKLQAEKCAVKMQLPETPPQLLADPFRLQQILTNLLLYALDHIPPAATLLCEVKIIHESPDKPFLALTIGPENPPPAASAPIPTDIRLELAKTLASLHGATLDIRYAADGLLAAIILLFDGKSLRFAEDAQHSA